MITSVEEIYNEWRREDERRIKDTEAFDRWCRANFFYDQATLSQLTENNAVYIGQLKTNAGDMGTALPHIAQEGSGTRASDWFEEPGRHPVGLTQEGNAVSRSTDISRQVSDGNADGVESGGCWFKDCLSKSGDVVRAVA